MTRKKSTSAETKARLRETKAWFRDASDERAAENGCWFDASVGGFAVWWIERFCRLYEGEFAGEPLLLRGCHQCDDPQPAAEEWDDESERAALARAERHAVCVKKGHAIDWQYDVTMRLFGWQRFSERWQRDIRRFRRASVWVPKKNKKSPTMAAWGIYLLAGDNELGQKVYFAAKDGSQAREIAGKHAVEMVQQSLLAEECSINRTLMQITHEPTRSILKPISSGDSKAQKAKEGLNGSILVDEVHVVDREFIGRISRAGISRVEPLHVEVSTAGNDPQSYGKERFDYAVNVAKGEWTDQDLLVSIHAAPEDLTDEALAKDPLHWGRLANPAWGHTVNEEEFLSDYNASRVNPVEFSRFKMYRLNVWQHSSSPWLVMEKWAKCRRTYSEDYLATLPCHAGLDLAMMRDTCSLVLVFTDADDTYWQLPFFWLPRARAELLQDKVKYLEWAAQGFITVTDGDVVDVQPIRLKLIELKKCFRIRKLAFDDFYATQLIQRLTEEDRAYRPDEVLAFEQSMTGFAGATDLYEGLVIQKKLYHPGNPVLTWQAGNARVRTDVNANKRPVKQKPGDFKTIDGVIGGIMALEMARAGRELDDWYRPGILRN